MITTADLSHALSRLGYSAVSNDTIAEILQEVDFDRKGSINFEDFIEIAAGLKGASPPSSLTAPKTGADLRFATPTCRALASLGLLAHCHAGRRLAGAPRRAYHHSPIWRRSLIAPSCLSPLPPLNMHLGSNLALSKKLPS